MDLNKGSRSRLMDSPSQHQLASVASKNTLTERKRHSMPPLLAPITILERDEQLPELTGTQAKIE